MVKISINKAYLTDKILVLDAVRDVGVVHLLCVRIAGGRGVAEPEPPLAEHPDPQLRAVVDDHACRGRHQLGTLLLYSEM